MQMAPMAHGFELCAPDAAFSLATEVLQHLNLCFADELSLTELTNRFHVSTSHMIHMFKAQFGLPPIQYMVRRRIGKRSICSAQRRTVRAILAVGSA